MKQPRKVGPSQFLSGWKEIANYLGKGVRTVQRYERHLGLPVRRPAGKSLGSVIATKPELDAWVNASPIRNIFFLRGSQQDAVSQARALKNRVSEMSKLRDQMLDLRIDVMNSVAMLHRSISDLQGTLHYTVPETRPVSSDNERELLARTFSAPMKHSKAS